MAGPRHNPKRRVEPGGPDGQSSRPAAWPGIPGPEEEHLGSLATHAKTKDAPARVTQSQKDLEREEKSNLEEWEEEKREEDELR